jgi:hypothetical protein
MLKVVSVWPEERDPKVSGAPPHQYQYSPNFSGIVALNAPASTVCGGTGAFGRLFPWRPGLRSAIDHFHGGTGTSWLRRGGARSWGRTPTQTVVRFPAIHSCCQRSRKDNVSSITPRASSWRPCSAFRRHASRGTRGTGRLLPPIPKRWHNPARVLRLIVADSITSSARTWSCGGRRHWNPDLIRLETRAACLSPQRR